MLVNIDGNSDALSAVYCRGLMPAIRWALVSTVTPRAVAKMSHLDVFERCVEHWRLRDVPLLPGASESEVVETFAQLGQEPSADVVRLYSLTGGFEDGYMDGFGFWLWNLATIRDANKNVDSPFVRFSDYFIQAHVYCLRRETGEVSSVHVDWSSAGQGDECVEAVTGSLAEFLEAYFEDSKQVFLF